jgi:L-cysteine:1D-myo-inositol 2-amino-2-deoxy-alpha-D-glucopyranoside ligase
MEPITDQDVGLYVCGVTPYDTSHLGHAFTYTVFDLLVRYLRFLGRNVTYVQNVTDIDDDVLLRAGRDNIDWQELGNREYGRFREAMASLGNLDPDVAPRATEHIPEMVAIIEKLVERGLAYVNEGSVYFEIKKDDDFGRLFKEPYEAMYTIANERGNFPADPLKRDPLDFVLWQRQKEGEPAWESPWGPGRPGWHIECSAMAMKYLGETITLHGGGGDLVFPHHDAEIAQSEGATGVRFVKHWIHPAMVFCGEHKMSKSLGNMVFVGDLLEKCSPDSLRLYLLSHHYRAPWDHPLDAPPPTDSLAEALRDVFTRQDEASNRDILKFGRPLFEALANDFDTAEAIEQLERLSEHDSVAARRAGATIGRDVFGLRYYV